MCLSLSLKKKEKGVLLPKLHAEFFFHKFTHISRVSWFYLTLATFAAAEISNRQRVK